MAVDEPSVSRPLHDGDALPIEPFEDREPSSRMLWIALAVFTCTAVITILTVTAGDPAVASLPIQPPTR